MYGSYTVDILFTIGHLCCIIVLDHWELLQQELQAIERKDAIDYEGTGTDDAGHRTSADMKAEDMDQATPRTLTPG